MKIKIGEEKITVPAFIAGAMKARPELREQFDAFIKELLAAQARHVREAVLGKERELLRELDFNGFFQSFEKLGHRG